jgi:hypothetical protein
MDNRSAGQPDDPGAGGQARMPRQSGDAATPGQSGDATTPGQSGDAATPGQSGDAATLGRVAALYLRQAHGAVPVQVDRVHACAGAGLDGDVQRDALSPRQLLIAGTPAYARLALAPNALRENVLLDIDSATLASGQLLAIGPSAVLQLTFPCEPCGGLDLRQPRLSRTIGAQRGMLARVLLTGTVCAGDPVRLLPDTLAPWSGAWRARVEAVLAQVPAGMVVEYRQLAVLAGVALTYCRVFPRVARALGLEHKAVPLRSHSVLPRWNGAGLFDQPAPRAPSGQDQDAVHVPPHDQAKAPVQALVQARAQAPVQAPVQDPVQEPAQAVPHAGNGSGAGAGAANV